MHADTNKMACRFQLISVHAINHHLKHSGENPFPCIKADAGGAMDVNTELPQIKSVFTQL
jgi:hypothetical protein